MDVRWFVSGSDGLTIALVALLIMTVNRGNGFCQTGAAPSPVLETVIARDADVGVDEPAPNSGGGDSTGYYFFGRRSKTPNFKGIFRKRILHKGAAIGVQPQPQDEVYTF